MMNVNATKKSSVTMTTTLELMTSCAVRPDDAPQLGAHVVEVLARSARRCSASLRSCFV